jgi:uncharacterized protein
MKLFVFSIIAFGLFSTANAQTYYGSTDVTIFRDGRDKELRDKKETPLKDEDLAGFKGLNYYPVDKSFRVTARLTRTADEKYFEMPTSSGRTKKFVKYGILIFQLGGKMRRLNVYQIDPAIRAKFPENADLLFIPFRDLTSRTETYGGGRYMDIKTPKDNRVKLDFNLAYNPNCAYGSDRYNCPIPPRENTLDIEVTAGEKRFMYSGYDKSH